MLNTVRSQLSRLIIVEKSVVYRHDPPDSHSSADSTREDLEFTVLKHPQDADMFVWESGAAELATVKRLLMNQEVVGIAHQNEVVHGRLAVRTSGWMTLSSRRKYRPLRPGEGLLHFVRTAGFARGRGLQSWMYLQMLSGRLPEGIDYLSSTVNTRNIPSIKGSERSGGVKMATIYSLGFLGGRLGFSIERPVESPRTQV